MRLSEDDMDLLVWLLAMVGAFGTGAYLGYGIAKDEDGIHR